MRQDKRLDFLVDEFRFDSKEYKDIEVPEDKAGKQRILRGLIFVTENRIERMRF